MSFMIALGFDYVFAVFCFTCLECYERKVFVSKIFGG